MPLIKPPVSIIAFEDQRMSLAALRVLGILCSYADQDGYCYPSQTTIAKRLNVSRPAVNRQIQVLVKLGYLEVSRRTTGSGGETSCLYRVITPGIEFESSSEDTELQWVLESDAHNVTPPVTLDVTQRSHLTSQLSQEREEEAEVVNLPRAREEAAADFSDESLEIPDDPFGDTLWTTTPDAPETPEEVICQAILPGNKPDQVQYPETVTEARNHPDIEIYRRVTGVLPYASYYKAVVDAIQFLRESCPTDDSLVKYLTPFWQKWKSSTRKDGQPYKPNNPAWLTDWAVTSANSNPASDGSDEECRYSYSVITNPTPAQYARAATVVFEEV